MQLATPRLLAALGLSLALLTACATQVPASSPPPAPSPVVAPSSASAADLSGIKSYLIESATTLKGNTAALKSSAEAYYTLAQAAGFDYAALWAAKPTEVRAALEGAKGAWMAASPGYERIEGIVAGVPSLAEYDVILDAGSAADDDPASAVPFDLTLPDGRVLKQPGNLFGLLEGTLWGTRSEFSANVPADLNGNGAQEFGEALPEANMLKASADELDRYSGEMLTAAQAWQPTESDAFTALVVMIPTMSEYFESWKQSRFVAGEASTQSEFVVISRLADIQDILAGLEVVYKGISPLVSSVDSAQDRQTSAGLNDLKGFVAEIYSQERGGKVFSAEEADTLGSEAQERAQALAGQIAQAAAQLKVSVQE